MEAVEVKVSSGLMGQVLSCSKEAAVLYLQTDGLDEHSVFGREGRVTAQQHLISSYCCFSQEASYHCSYEMLE